MVVCERPGGVCRFGYKIPCQGSKHRPVAPSTLPNSGRLKQQATAESDLGKEYRYHPWEQRATCTALALAHVFTAFRGYSVTARGITAIPSLCTSHTAQSHFPPGAGGSCEALGRDLPPLAPCKIAPILSPALGSSYASASLRARHELRTGQVEHEGLLTVQTVAPSSMRACEESGRVCTTINNQQ